MRLPPPHPSRSTESMGTLAGDAAASKFGRSPRLVGYLTTSHGDSVNPVPEYQVNGSMRSS
jgi:hypothetical protein